MQSLYHYINHKPRVAIYKAVTSFEYVIVYRWIAMHRVEAVNTISIKSDGKIFREKDTRPSTSTSLTSIHPLMSSIHCPQTVLKQIMVNKIAKIPQIFIYTAHICMFLCFKAKKSKIIKSFVQVKSQIHPVLRKSKFLHIN